MFNLFPTPSNRLLGIGIDVLQISRIQKIQSQPKSNWLRFQNRILTPWERDELTTWSSNPMQEVQYVATR
jgi:phosphopantetheinyl transferase (holo-ACP synthase)